jgi:hypothetical protein
VTAAAAEFVATAAGDSLQSAVSSVVVISRMRVRAVSWVGDDLVISAIKASTHRWMGVFVLIARADSVLVKSSILYYKL